MTSYVTNNGYTTESAFTKVLSAKTVSVSSTSKGAKKYANKTKFKIAYISTIETGDANLTCKNIDSIAESLGIKPADLFNEETAKLAKKLPPRVDMYK